MPESPVPPPLADDDEGTEPGWYPDTQAPGLLPWRDGEAWSETDIKLAGEDGYPWWHPESLRDRFGPFTRVGSMLNVLACGLIAAGFLVSGLVSDLLGVGLLLGIEAVFVYIAIRVWRG